ncbi:MAG TPA: hypothetical protein VGS05_09825 [Candidatus Sulfotelmatobacter sp.]|nr:hypothetical protein [Candidatus Sulfotelmatobacter sp.]
MNMKAVIMLLAVSVPAFALKSRERTFPQDCDVVWKASMAVAKSEQYRIISVSKEEQIISLEVGGFIAGERIVSLNLSSLNGDGCTVAVQSKFSGLIHSDGPDLLRRIEVELVGNWLDRESKAFRHFQNCMEFTKDESNCQKHLRKDLDRESAKAANSHPATDSKPSLDRYWPNPPTAAKKDNP